MYERERLMSEIREIESKIKMLKNSAITCGTVKVEKEHYSLSRPDEWVLFIKMQYDGIPERIGGWCSVIRATDRQVVIDRIPALIADLQGLKEMLEGGND